MKEVRQNIRKWGQNMIIADKVSKKLGSFTLKDISFQLPKGYIMGLIGPNGAGKTTLIHLLVDLYTPDAGTIMIDGIPTAQDKKEIKNKVGVVLTEQLFTGELTLLENGDMYGKYFAEYDREVLLQYCTRFRLEPDKKLKRHSKGEQLKFQLAFALAHNPSLLILDEPTANFDPEFREEVFHILSSFIADGEHSVLLATHVTEDLDRIADYIVFLDKGELVFAMDKESMYERYRLVEGENYKINLLPQDRIIYREKRDYSTRALVRHRSHIPYDREMTVTIPTIEDIMYGIVKGGREHA